jgi:HD-like signal output (HDOD) protein
MSFPASSEYPTPERLVAALGQLPPVAHVLARLQRLLADPNSGLDDIAELIRLDAALTTRVIQISNSVWFGRGLPCSTIVEAVNRVGFREVYRLVAVVASGSMVAQPLAAYGRDAVMGWRESVACAFAAEMLAERLGEDMPAAYMSGLLHAVGRLPINQYVITGSETFKPFVDEGFPRDFSGAEYALFGFNQADVGAHMLRKWDFNPSIVEPIRMQYEPLEAQEPHDRLSAVLYGARFLRSVICNNAGSDDLTGDEEVFAALRLSREDLLSHVPELKDNLSRVHSMTKI